MPLCQFKSNEPDLQIEIISEKEIKGQDLMVEDVGVGVVVGIKRMDLRGKARTQEIYLDDAMLDAIVAMVEARNARNAKNVDCNLPAL